MTDGYAVPPAERVVARMRQHVRRMFWPSIALIVICGAAGYFGSMFDGWLAIVVWVVAGVLAVMLFLLPFGSWLTTRYTVTTRRLIVRTGLFVHERRELLHSRGYTVTLRSSWLQSAFRSGTIAIGAMDQKTMAQLRDVPHAQAVSDALHDLMESSERMYPTNWETESAASKQGGGFPQAGDAV